MTLPLDAITRISSTTHASTATAATGHPSSSKQPTTLPNQPTPTRVGNQ